jgi:hypothetical protein
MDFSAHELDAANPYFLKSFSIVISSFACVSTRQMIEISLGKSKM